MNLTQKSLNASAKLFGFLPHKPLSFHFGAAGHSLVWAALIFIPESFGVVQVTVVFICFHYLGSEKGQSVAIYS